MKTTEETQRATKGGSVPAPSWPVKKRTHADDVKAWVLFRARCARLMGKEQSPYMQSLELLQEGVR